jgi:protoheme IX farnesyltransferase
VKSDYARVGIPMMPVVAGEKSTRLQILAYSLMLVPLAASPWFIGGTGPIYGVAALVLSLAFLLLSLPVAFRTADEGDGNRPEKRLFGFSVIYLFALFAVLVADRFVAVQGAAA